MIRNKWILYLGCILLIAQDCSSKAKEENQHGTLRIVRAEDSVTGGNATSAIHSSGSSLNAGNADDMPHVVFVQITATPNNEFSSQIVHGNAWGTSISNGVETISLIPYTPTPPNSPIPPNPISDIVLSTQFSASEV